MKTSNSFLKTSRVASLLPACLVLALGAVTASAETTINVGGAGTIGTNTLTTSGGIARLPDNGDTWKTKGGTGNTYSYLQSPALTVQSNGPVTLTFTHRWFFEPDYDGGAVYVNVNGFGFSQVPLTNFSANGYNTNVTSGVWFTEDVFGGQSPGWSTPTLVTSVATLGTNNAGDFVQVEFRGGWDAGYIEPFPNWEIGTFQVADLSGTLTNVDFTAAGPSGFTASTSATGTPSPWIYLTPLFKFEINGDTLATDRIKASTTPAVIDLNNARIQVVLLAGTLDIGDTFSLFDLSGGTTLSGSIASISLPGGVAWDTSSLATAGTITVTAITAADGSWIADANGNWSDTNNWAGGIAADWIGRTANFTNGITADRTVTLDVNKTIGTIVYTDANGNNNNLTISGANVLTLEVTNGKPVINVTQAGRQLTISSVISGTNGFQKEGPGVFNATGANTYSGATFAANGILNFGAASADGFGGGPGSRDIFVTLSNIVQRGYQVLNNAFLNRLAETTNEIGVFANATGASGVNTNNMDFSSSTGANLPNAFFGTWAGNGAQSRYDGIITPASDNYRIGYPGHSGTLHITQAHGDVGGTPRGLIVAGGSVNLTGENTFTGDTVLRAGRLFLGRNLAIQNSALNVGTPTDGIAGQICFLASNAGGSATNAQLTDQPVIGGLIGSRNLSTVYNNANANNTTRLAPTAVVGLTLNVATNKTCTYSGNVRIATGMYLTKTGPGTQILSGNSDYTGPTTISNGTLTVSGFVTNTTASVTVADGATFNVSGKGSLAAIASPGTLTLGACTLGFSGLTSATVAPLNANDVVVTGTVTINISGGLNVGQLPLIKSAIPLTAAGPFVLGSLPSGVTATLVTNTINQSIDLNVTGAPVSIITDLPTTTSYRFVGGAYSLSVVAGGTPPLTYSWSRNGVPVGGNSPTLTLNNLVVGDSGAYSVAVSNATTSAQSSTNSLVVVPASSSYDGIVLASSPLAYWPLNEASGPTAIDYAANYPGAYTASGVTYSVAGPASNQVVTLDGTNGTVTIPYTPALNPSAFSFEIWVKPAQVPYAGATVAYIASSAVIPSPRSGWYLAQDGTGATFGAGSAFVVRLFDLNGTTQSIQLAAPVTAPGWYHLVLTYDGTTASLYRNGVLTQSGLAAFVPNVSAPLTIGMRSDAPATLRWPGSLGNVALYNRALTSTEVAQHSLNLQPVLNYTWSSGVLTLNWTGGVLEAAPDVNGTYTEVPGAVSPYVVPTTDPQSFFRVKN